MKIEITKKGDLWVLEHKDGNKSVTYSAINPQKIAGIAAQLMTEADDEKIGAELAKLPREMFVFENRHNQVAHITRQTAVEVIAICDGASKDYINYLLDEVTSGEVGAVSFSSGIIRRPV